MEETIKNKKSFAQKLDDFFQITERGSKISTEIVAGIVTFLAMAYILIVNPNNIIGDTTNANWPSVFIATAFGAVIGTLLMSLLAKMPLAQAPGMGLNAQVGGLLGGWGAFACSFGNAMLLVAISGVLFLLLSVITIKGIAIRQLIYKGIPECIRKAISVGIGLFIAFIGLQGAGIIQANQFTLVSKIDFTTWDLAANANAIVCLVGVIAITTIQHFNGKGSVIFGIIIATLVGIPLGVTKWSGMTWDFTHYFANFFSMDPNNGGTFLAAFTGGFDWSNSTATVFGAIVVVITFCMIDMFDTMGTVVGCCEPVGLMDENDVPLNYNKIMVSDSVATVAGSLLGTSTVTTFVESGSGIAAGGKTGLTSLVTAICFFLSIFIMPLIASIPSAATYSALIYVGALMAKGTLNLKLKTCRDLVSSFLVIAMMPLTYSITDGIGYGLVAYIAVTLIVHFCKLVRFWFKKGDKPHFDLNIVTIIIGALFLVYYLVPAK